MNGSSEGQIGVKLKILGTISLILTATIVFVAFQNCARKANFGNYSDGSLGSLYFDQGDCNRGCWNSEMKAVENVFIPDVKVVMVVDNSTSMAKIQDSMGRGVNQIIDDLRGIDASFMLYSTTQDVAKPKTTVGVTIGCEVKDALTGKVSLTTNCPTVKELGKVYTKFENYGLTSSLIPKEYRLTHDMTDESFNATKKLVSDSIKAVGTNGSNDEQGLCTLARTVYEEGENSIFKPGDLAAFLVISDDNDKTLKSGGPTSCLSRIETATSCLEEDTTPIPVGGTHACDNDSCTYYDVPYTIVLTGNPIPDSVSLSYKKQQSGQVLSGGYRVKRKTDYTTKYSYNVIPKPTVRVSYKIQEQVSDGNVTNWSAAIPKSLADRQVVICDTPAAICTAAVASLGLPTNQRYVDGSCVATCGSGAAAPQSYQKTNSSCDGNYTATASDCRTDSTITGRIQTGETMTTCSAVCTTNNYNESSATFTLDVSACPSPVAGVACSAADEATMMGRVSTSDNYVAGSCKYSSCGAYAISGTKSHTAPSTTTCSQAGTSCLDGTYAAYLSAQGKLAANESLVACTIGCTPGGPDVSTHAPTIKTYKPQSSVDYCSSPYKASNGTTYANIGEYYRQVNGKVSATCVRGALGTAKLEQIPNGTTLPPKGTPKCTTASTKTLSFPKTTEVGNVTDMAKSFVDRSRAIFGTRVMVSGILTTETVKYQGANVSPCADSSENGWAPVSVGQRYLDLIRNVSSSGVVGSVCDVDYSPTLSTVSSWIQHKIKTTYKAADVIASMNHRILAVWLKGKDGKIRNLEMGKDVAVNQDVIEFLRDDLVEKEDIIGYTVRRDKAVVIDVGVDKSSRPHWAGIGGVINVGLVTA